MNYIVILKLIVQLLPVVLDTIKIAETEIPQSGQGAAKLAFVKNILTQTVDVSKDVSAADYSTAIEKAVGIAVSLFNATGIFKKGA